MFFRPTEKQTVLGLHPDPTSGAAVGAETPASTQATLNVQEKVHQYYDEFHLAVLHYLTATFGGERSLAEEITQDAFLQLYRYLNGGHSIHNVRAWTFRVAHNMAINRLKREQFIAAITDEEWNDLQASVPSREPNPEQTLLQNEKIERLSRAISRLTLIERQCLNLRTKGFRYREIAEIVELSLKVVSDTLYRVIAKLTKEIND